MCSDIFFEVCYDYKIKSIVTVVWYVINFFVGWSIVYGLGTGFVGDADEINFWLHKGIEIGFQIYILRFVIKTSFRVLWRESKMELMVKEIYLLLVGWYKVVVEMHMD